MGIDTFSLWQLLASVYSSKTLGVESLRPKYSGLESCKLTKPRLLSNIGWIEHSALLDHMCPTQEAYRSMKKIAGITLLLTLLTIQSSCTVRSMLAPPYKTYEIPLSGKGRLGWPIDHGILLGSYNIDQHKIIVEKDIDIYEYDFKNHTKKLDHQIKNTRINFVQFIDYEIPYIFSKNQHRVYFYHRWVGSTYTITKKVDEKEEIIFERQNLTKSHSIQFVIVDSLQNNQVITYFTSYDQFESKIFEILQYDINTGSIRKVAVGSGRLYSIPYYETRSYIYLEVRDIDQPRKIFCIRKSDYVLEKIIPIDRQYLVGSDYGSDLLVAYNHKTFELTLWKGSAIQDVIKCSQLPYPIDSVTIKVFQGKIYLLAVIEEGFDTDKRMLRWIKFDQSTKRITEKNWNQDLRYRLYRSTYSSTKNDFYILGYEKATRKVVFGIANLIEGTIHYRSSDHQIPKDLEFVSSQFIGDNYCLWFEGTSYKDASATGEKQTFNPIGYYCSLEEPLLQRIKK
jgi:hypothetical protein